VGTGRPSLALGLRKTEVPELGQTVLDAVDMMWSPVKGEWAAVVTRRANIFICTVYY
jgi:hypothetical protein